MSTLILTNACKRLVWLQVLRRAVMKQQRRTNSQLKSLVLHMMGYRPPPTMPKKVGDALVKRADPIIKSLAGVDKIAFKEEAATGLGLPPTMLHTIDGVSETIDSLSAQDQPILHRLLPIARVLFAARRPIDEARAGYEKEMKAEVVNFPQAVQDHIENTPGLGAPGVAILIGETGTLSGYTTPAKVWKRLGVAVINGERQGLGLTGDAVKAKAHGYNKARRAVLFNVGDSLLKTQLRKDESGTTTATGAYGLLYLAEKERQKTINPGLRPIVYHRRAQRKMEKRLLLDLWKAWNK